MLSDVRAIACLLLGSIILPACAPRSPLEAVLEERRKYTVSANSWAERDDGTLVVHVTITGPVNRKIDVLTVEVRRLGADDAVLASNWIPLDLTRMVRGTPIRETVVLDAGDGRTVGLVLDPHSEPSSEDLAKLSEVAGIRRGRE